MINTEKNTLPSIITDKDIEIWFWQSKYYHSQTELVKANKGIRRLKRGNNHLQGKSCKGDTCIWCQEELDKHHD